MSDMTRREFTALVGGVALLLAVRVRRARAQQAAMPVIAGTLEMPTKQGVLKRQSNSQGNRF